MYNNITNIILTQGKEYLLQQTLIFLMITKSPKIIYRVEAVAPSSLLLRASLRAWSVAKEELPRLSFGAH